MARAGEADKVVGRAGAAGDSQVVFLIVADKAAHTQGRSVSGKEGENKLEGTRLKLWVVR